MEKFREILVDITLSSHLPCYRDIFFEGKKKRDLCAYFDGNYCNKFKITNNNIPANWISNNKMNPHPIVCYICPYFSIRYEDKTIALDFFDILLYYEELRETVERELTFIENKMIGVSFPLSLKKRRDDLIALLNDIETKIKVLKELLKIYK